MNKIIKKNLIFLDFGRKTLGKGLEIDRCRFFRFQTSLFY